MADLTKQQLEEKIIQTLKTCYDPVTQQLIPANSHKIAKKLAQYAIDKGSTDNVTTIVVFF